MKHAVVRRLGRPVLVAALTGGALAGGVTPAALAAPASATASPASVTASPAYATGVFGPFGYGGVKLGMSAKQARATKKITAKAGWGPCTGWDLTASPTGRGEVGLFISKRRGVAVIFAPKGVKTPQGIGIGSTGTQLKKAYPDLKLSASGYPVVTAPGNPRASYSFLLSRGRIRQMILGLNNQDCVN
ncbi:hypothetical protein [Streptosporangium sp. NPDC051022]|uniref:hypothetical protein n=1 Tax=Streptosporangium sp. NPDC051022 TaxID=3155752 RepID=UPI003420F7EF